MSHEVQQDESGSPADPRIAAALARLEELTGRPPEEHAEVYEDVHRVLAESLADAQAERRPGEAGSERPTAEDTQS